MVSTTAAVQSNFSPTMGSRQETAISGPLGESLGGCAAPGRQRADERPVLGDDCRGIV